MTRNLNAIYEDNDNADDVFKMISDMLRAFKQGYNSRTKASTGYNLRTEETLH